jgi:hypothetical protein
MASTTTTLRATTESLIDEMTKHPSWSTSQRLRYAVRTHEEFAKAYPRLLDMCLNVRSFTDARDVGGILDMMLAEMEKIDANDETFVTSSTVVGKSLGARFLPNENATSEKNM